MTYDRDDEAEPDDQGPLSTPEFPPSLIPTEDDEGSLTAEESRAKADPRSPEGQRAGADPDADPGTEPPA